MMRRHKIRSVGWQDASCQDWRLGRFLIQSGTHRRLAPDYLLVRAVVGIRKQCADHARRVTVGIWSYLRQFTAPSS